MATTGVRAARKEATRTKVLNAARDLFIEVGFEAATIRAIAARAGVSIGSVFTCFASKFDILREVMTERLDQLYAELDGLAPHLRGSTADRLRSIMAVHYNFEMKWPRLFTAYVASNFEWADEPSLSPFGRNPRLTGMIRDILRRGVEAGEVRADADLDLFVDMLVSLYGFNYRCAAREGADAVALTAMMDRQIGLLIEGVAP